MVFTGNTFLDRWLSVRDAKCKGSANTGIFEALTSILKGPLPHKDPLPFLCPGSLGENTITTKTNFLFVLIKMPVLGM